MNRVYLSSLFSHKDRIKAYAEELTELGVDVTSSWVGENASPHVQSTDLTDDYLRGTAILDIRDMLNANKFVLFVPTDEELELVPKRSLSRGGRNFESGFFYALIYLRKFLPLPFPPKDELILVGQRESVFHFLFGMTPEQAFVRGLELPEITQFDSWDEAKKYIASSVIKFSNGSKIQIKGEVPIEFKET